MIKNIKKNFKNFGLSILTAVGMFSLNACNNTNSENVIPVCDVNPAVEYAESLGFPNPEVFSPLGKDCEIEGENIKDKEFISFAKEKYEDIGLENLEGIVLRFGSEDQKGKNYTISNSEFNAIIYSFYNSYIPLFKPEGLKFTEKMIQGFFSIDKGAKLLSNVDRSIESGLSFPIIYDDNGTKGNFFLFQATSDSDAKCSSIYETMREGYDQIISRNTETKFINNSFVDWKVVKVIEEKFSSGEWRFYPEESYTVVLKPEEFDSSLYDEDFLIVLGHTFLFKDSSGFNHPPKLEYILKAPKVNSDGSLTPQNYLNNIVMPYSEIINIDYDYLETNPNNTIPENKDRVYFPLEGVFKTYYYKDPYDKRKRRIILEKPLQVDSINGYTVKVSFEKLVSPGSVVDPDGLDRIVCKVEYDLK